MSKQKRKQSLTPEQEKLLQKFQNDTGDNSVSSMEKGNAPKSKPQNVTLPSMRRSGSRGK
jgi:hypothetical protein